MEKENKDDENKVKGMSTGKKLLLLFFFGGFLIKLKIIKK